MALIKTAEEIELIRESCRLLGIVHKELGEKLKPGMTTKEIDIMADVLIRKLGGIPNFKNYGGFPGSVCVSVNEVVVHGIPSKHIRIEEGDIVSLDAGLIYKGYHSDAARTHAVGVVDDDKKKLMEVTKQSFFEGIKMAKAGNHLHDISNAIDAFIKPYGYGIVRELVGHGIGTSLHEEPQIPNFAQKTRGMVLKPGMTLCVEPMINMGRADIEQLDDGWTIVAADGLPSSHYENTILITEGEPEILTLCD